MKTLIVIEGATGSGKTGLALQVAESLRCEIISADSRQIYRDIPIGTAAPTAEELSRIKHHFVGTLGLEEYYSAALFENDVLGLLPSLWEKGDYVVMCGGSMMYIDAVTNGIDDLPTISNEIRSYAASLLENEGLEGVRKRLKEIDPAYYDIVDLNNPRRIVHAIEITMQAGVPYSTLRRKTKKERDFKIIKFAIDLPREVLFDRINRRVDAMIEGGLIDEAKNVYHLRHLNALNTVGYKEMFAWFDGKMDKETAISRMAKNTRVYAKKQLTWIKKDPELHWLDPSRDLLLQVLDALNS